MAAADVSSTKLSLPKGPGSIEGLASADFAPKLATGNASYSVEIALPPGARGLKPKLALAYDSGGGVSEMGIGWRLSGVAKIQRRTNEGLPRFDETDRFEVAGLGTPADLIEVDAGVFRPQYEDGTFLRAKRSASGDVWEVRLKSGTALVFGGEGFTEEEGGHVASYLLKKQVDLRGNTITYEWETSQGYALLTRVVWNDTAEEHRNEVVLHYEDRPDPSRLFSRGIKQALSQRLERIEVKHGGDLVRRYDLRYSDDAHPRLVAVTLVGRDGEASMPAATFEYTGSILDAAGTSPSAELVSMQSPPGRSPSEPDASLADLNGDGLPDLLIAEAGNYRSYINVDGQSWESGTDWATSESPSVSLSEGCPDFLDRSRARSLRKPGGRTQVGGSRRRRLLGGERRNHHRS